MSCASNEASTEKLKQMKNYSKEDLLKIRFVTNKFNGDNMEILSKDPYGWNAPEPPTENHVFIRDVKWNSQTFYRGCYTTVEDVNYVLD